MNEDGTRARGIIAVIATLALVGLAGLLMFTEPKPGSKEVLLLVVGALIAMVADIKQFYFGSSSGNKVLMAGQQKITEQAVTAVAASSPAGTGSGLSSPGAPTGTPSDPISTTETPAPPAEAPRAPTIPLSIRMANAELEPGFITFRRTYKSAKPGATDEEVLAQWRVASADDLTT
jgi:hypothetical protein